MPNNSTVALLVEDNLADSQYTQELLSGPDYVFLSAVNLAQAFEYLSSTAVDVILLDLSLPDSHGLPTLKSIVSRCEIPVVVLTGLEDIEFAVETLKLGARDYIVKNRLTPEALARSISYAIESTKRAVIEAQLVEAEQDLRLVLEGSQTGTWVRSFESGLFTCDEQARKLFGVENSFGQTFDHFLELVYPDDRQVVLSSYATHSHNAEYRVVWADQSTHWIASTGKIAFDDFGKPFRAAGICIDIDERKQAEKERSQLAAIVESSDAAIIGKTLDDIVTSWNRSAERIYGYTTEEMLGRNIAILIPEQAKSEMLALTNRVVSGECIDQYESKRIRKDGVMIDCAGSISPLKDACGNIIGIATITRDISARKRAEKLHAIQNEVTILLLETKTLLEAAPRVLRLIAEVLNCSVGMLWQLDPLHNVLRNVDVWTSSIDDYRDFTLISKHLTFASGQDLLGRVWKTKRPEWFVDLKDRSNFSRSLSADTTGLHYAYAVPIMQDQVVGALEFFGSEPAEITEEVKNMVSNISAQLWQLMNRKWTEEAIDQAIHAQRTIAQAILENAPIGIAKLSRDLRFNEVNKAFTLQFGVSSDRLPGKSIFEVTTGLPVENILNVVRDGTTFRVEDVRLAFEGTSPESRDPDTCWDLAAWPIKDIADAVTGVILITADATERAKLSRQREDFVATLTHDLKNPLIGQDRMLKLLVGGAFGTLNPEQVKMLTLLQTSTADMLALIGNLLEIYRYDAGVPQLRIEPCEMKEVVDACIAQISSLAARKSVRVISTVSDTTIAADVAGIRRVVMNLLDNAVKFSPANSDVEVWSEYIENMFVLHFKDCGIGIEKNQRRHLFKRFGQTDLGKSFTTGTGLGLYLCRQIMESQGGSINYQSKVGDGSTFSVALLLDRSRLDDSADTLLGRSEVTL
ncbi:MAG: PAS domain S-box protein [Candidatus Melainabacteria bacterium]|nr:PAS domain S-box protein [Candidatus Melainabacteria bacterium]